MWGSRGTGTTGTSDGRQLGRTREEIISTVVDQVAHFFEVSVLHTTRIPQYDCDLTGPMYTAWILNGHERNMWEVYRINHATFFLLRDALLDGGHFVPGYRGVRLEEALLMFLYLVCQDMRMRTVCDRFQHCTETVGRTIGKVRKALVSLSSVVICPRNEQVVHHRIRNNSKLFPYFKDCIGAIDGTHIIAAVPQSQSRVYRNRHGELSQNVLCVVDNDRRFVFVYVGVGGSAHDASVLEGAIANPNHMFPMPPVGKYYVADSAYQSKPGFMCPFRGKPYHPPDHNRSGFQDKEELFNHRHSSTRNIVERSFGILKRKFHFLVGPTYSYDLKVQGEFVLACCAIFNFILLHNPDDEDLREPEEDGYDATGHLVDDSYLIGTSNLPPGDRNQSSAWNAYREHIAEVMWMKHQGASTSMPMPV